MEHEFLDITCLFNWDCGVYILLQNEEVMYVGQSQYIPIRVHTHRRDNRFQFDKVVVRYCEPNDLDLIEAELIKELKPMHNRNSGRNSFRPKTLSLAEYRALKGVR